MSSSNYEKCKKYIEELGFDINIDDYPKLVEDVEFFSDRDDINGLKDYMKQLQNCGGYALQIPICIFSESNYTFEEKVLRILELYPFVRLLSDTELKENEYLVAFRAGKTGHHFIRIDNMTEKKECNLPGKFEGWGNLEDSPEAIFAVIKQECRDEHIKELPQCNRSMFLSQEAFYKIEDDGYVDIIKKDACKPKTFEDLIQENYKNKKQSFIYNNKNFSFKISQNDPEIIYVCDAKEIVGHFYTDGTDFDIEIDETKHNSIFGFQPSKSILNYKKQDELEK